MNELHRIQIYDNWETLTSRIRMNDVKRRFLEQNNHWYRWTKALRINDLRKKIPFYDEQLKQKKIENESGINKAWQLPNVVREKEASERKEKEGNWKIDQLTNSAPQRNWFRIIKGIRKKMYSTQFFDGYVSEKEVYAESEKEEHDEQEEEAEESSE